MKNKNLYGIVSFMLYLIGLFIIGLGFLLKYLDGAEFSGFFVVFAIIVSAIPFLLSAVFGVCNIFAYYSKKSPVRGSRFFLGFSWFAAAAVGLPCIGLLIYNVAAFFLALIP